MMNFDNSVVIFVAYQLISNFHFKCINFDYFSTSKRSFMINKFFYEIHHHHLLLLFCERCVCTRLCLFVPFLLFTLRAPEGESAVAVVNVSFCFQWLHIAPGPSKSVHHDTPFYNRISFLPRTFFRSLSFSLSLWCIAYGFSTISNKLSGFSCVFLQFWCNSIRWKMNYSVYEDL